MIEGIGLSKNYGNLAVLKSVDVSIKKREILSITGPSGAGKSTLLQILGTLDKTDSGTLKFNGTNILSYSPKKIAKFRNENIGFIFQFHHLLPEFSALENVSKLLGKKKNVTDVSIFSDGTSIYVLTENDQMIDLLKKGQAVFGISLGPVHTETEAEIFSLFPEKISVQNR